MSGLFATRISHLAEDNGLRTVRTKAKPGVSFVYAF